MRSHQLTWIPDVGWKTDGNPCLDAQLVIYFGANEALCCAAWYDDLRALYPTAHIVGCSSGGQIQRTACSEIGIVAVAIAFARTRVRIVTENADDPLLARVHGEALGRGLVSDDLAGVFVLSDGLNVNGSELVRGLASVLGQQVTISGGLAGDGDRFVETRVGADAPPQPRTIAAIGFYGSAVTVSCGSGGGWDTFGVPRRITRSRNNELFEIDGKPALDLYERYLGDEAAGLPGTALLYPLTIWNPDNPSHSLVRAVLGINRDAHSVIFGADVPEGSRAQLMRGEFSSLSAGARTAAVQAAAGQAGHESAGSVALLVSCIGRRLLMGQRIEDEIHAVNDVLSDGISQLGFYSYGEIAPHSSSGVCDLHNQTMTITIISESAT